jgi:prophage regulatory protein
MNESPASSLGILRRPGVQQRLGIARSTLYACLDKRSAQFKPEFPKPIRLGVITGLVVHEIDEYLLGLMRAGRG